MKKTHKPELGQKLFSLNVGNASRGRKQILTPVIVTKVGNKYFTCERANGEWKNPTEYLINGWSEKTDYSANSRLYESEQEWLDEKEYNCLNKLIRESFVSYAKNDFTIDQLRRIVKIIEE